MTALRDIPTATLVGSAALVFSVLYLVSDVIEALQGGFSGGQLGLALIAEAAIPVVVIGLYVMQRSRIGRLGRLSAAAYAYAVCSSPAPWSMRSRWDQRLHGAQPRPAAVDDHPRRGHGARRSWLRRRGDQIQGPAALDRHRPDGGVVLVSLSQTLPEGARCWPPRSATSDSLAWELAIYYEGTAKPSLGRLGVTVRDPSGQPVGVTAYRGDVRYDRAGLVAKAVGSFDVGTTGRYTVSAGAPAEARAKLAVGDDLGGAMNDAVLWAGPRPGRGRHPRGDYRTADDTAEAGHDRHGQRSASRCADRLVVDGPRKTKKPAPRPRRPSPAHYRSAGSGRRPAPRALGRLRIGRAAPSPVARDERRGADGDLPRR